MLHCGSLGEFSKILGHRHSFTEAVIEMLLKNSYKFYNSEIILLNIVLSRIS